MPEQLELTPEQEAILNHPISEHGRVLAGPGTGKSTAAIALAKQLLSLDNPPRIKFLTFTRAATAELTRRLQDTFGIEGASTIHSFSISAILANPGCAYYPQPLRIADDYEKKLINKHIANLLNLPSTRVEELFELMASAWESLDPEEFNSVSETERNRFYGQWDEHRRTLGYTLLDELPSMFLYALENNVQLNGINYQLLIVDEYQDLNACDLMVIRLLSDRGSSILALGDDDQSIYSFRKAHPIGIRRFLEEYDTQHDYHLTICKRSPSDILRWAESVIQGDSQRNREPLDFDEYAPQGTCKLLRFSNDRAETQQLCRLINWLINDREIPPNEIIVLTRTDNHGTFTRDLKSELQSMEIPVSDPDLIDDLLSEDDNRRILCLLRLVTNQTDSLAWWTLITIYRGLGNTFLSSIYQNAIEHGITFGESFISNALNGFLDFSTSQKNIALRFWEYYDNLINNIPPRDENITWGEWIIHNIDNGTLPNCSADFRQLIIDIDSKIEYGEDLGFYLSQINRVGKDFCLEHCNGVRFMSMFRAKGLTVRATIVMGVDNDFIPRPNNPINEERRLLYVAMTRAKEYLFLTWANYRHGPAARSGRSNQNRRQVSSFLQRGPVASEDGRAYIESLLQNH